MALRRGKGPLDGGSSISSDLEKCFLGAHAEPNALAVELEKENAKLKAQYEDLRYQYRQLLEESKEERFDERRINLLKAQVMQLERQAILLSEGLSSQVCRSQDVEKALDPLTQRLRSLLLSSEDPAADVAIARTELTQLVERCEDVRQKLHRNNQVTFPEDLAMPWMLSGSKLSKQSTTLLDLCYGKTDNLNLQGVASPEQQVIQELELENIMAVLPAFPRGAPLQRARRAAQALSRAANYSVLMAQQQVEALEAELDFHRSLYSLQVRTIEELVQGIRKAYQAFQENIFQSLCVPLQDVLSCFEDLRSTASEAALHRFLSAFKSNLAQIREAVDAVSPSKSEGDAALEQYGQDFLQTVEKLLKECTEKREEAASQLRSLQHEQQQAVQTLHLLRAQRKEVSAEKARLRSACPENARCESSDAQPGGAGKPKAVPKQPSSVPAEQTNPAIHRTPSGHVSTNSSSQEKGVNQRPGREEDGPKRRSSFRGKSRKTADRPEWQT